MGNVCKICKTKFDEKDALIHFCPNCGYRPVSVKERNEYLAQINEKLPEEARIVLTDDHKNNARSVATAFWNIYDDPEKLTLDTISNMTCICFKEVDNKNEEIYHILADIYLLCSTYMPADRYYIFWLNKSAEHGNVPDKLTLKYLTEGMSDFAE